MVAHLKPVAEQLLNPVVFVFFLGKIHGLIHSFFDGSGAVHRVFAFRYGSNDDIFGLESQTGHIAVVLAVFTQITGINAILYYAPEIFKRAGAGTNAAFAQTVAVGAVNLTFTVLAMATIDRFGRRILLLLGVTSMGVFLTLTGRAFQTQSFEGPWVLIFVLAYCASFAFSLGVVFWVLVAEIFPTRIRGRAVAIGAFFVWCSCYLVSQTFPMLVEWMGSAKTFYAYAVMCLFTILFVWRVVPETKGKTLEEIEQWWRPNDKAG